MMSKTFARLCKHNEQYMQYIQYSAVTLVSAGGGQRYEHRHHQGCTWPREWMALLQDWTLTPEQLIICYTNGSVLEHHLISVTPRYSLDIQNTLESVLCHNHCIALCCSTVTWLFSISLPPLWTRTWYDDVWYLGQLCTQSGAMCSFFFFCFMVVLWPFECTHILISL